MNGATEHTFHKVIVTVRSFFKQSWAVGQVYKLVVLTKARNGATKNAEKVAAGSVFATERLLKTDKLIYTKNASEQSAV